MSATATRVSRDSRKASGDGAAGSPVASDSTRTSRSPAHITTGSPAIAATSTSRTGPDSSFSATSPAQVDDLEIAFPASAQGGWLTADPGDGDRREVVGNMDGMTPLFGQAVVRAEVIAGDAARQRGRRDDDRAAAEGIVEDREPERL